MESPDIRNWIGKTYPLPFNELYYRRYISSYSSEIVEDKIKIEFFIYVMNRLANAYNSRCGSNYDVLGNYYSAVGWKLPIGGSNDTAVFVDRALDSPFYIVKYGYTLDTVTYPTNPIQHYDSIRPVGSLNE